MSYIEEYLEAGAAGKINIPKRVIKQYENLVPILEGKSSRWYFNEKLARKPIDFAERFCRQSKDAWAGKPLRLILWQKAVYEAIYGIVERGTDFRKHRRALVLVGKKNGKTTMAAPPALYETSKKGNEVYCAANALDQAKIIYTAALNMLAQSPQLQQILRKRQFYIENIRPNGFSTFRALCNTPNLLDGKLPKFVILDEIHELQQALYDILYRGQISIADPMIFMLTTKGYVREELFDSEYKNSCDIIDGVIDDERKFSVLYELDEPQNWLDDKRWEQANPSLGYTISLDNLRDAVTTALTKPKELNSLKVKQFNIGGVSGDAYFEFDKINNERTFHIEKYKGYPAIGAFDLSLTNDLTAFCTLLWDADVGEYVADIMFWISQDFYNTALQDSRMAETWRLWVERGYVQIAGKNSIDYSQIVEYAIMMTDKYGILYTYIYYDSYSARYIVNAFDCAGYREGDCLIPCRQGSKTLSVPFQQLEVALNAKEVNYNNNPVVKWCITNVAVQEDVRNKNLLPCKAGHNNLRKIDGFAVLLDAFVGMVEHRDEFIY